MAMKGFLESLDGLDPVLAGEYVEDKEAGGFRLDIDGKDTQAKVREFRSNNVAHEKTIAELQKTAKAFSGVDLEQYKVGQELLKQIGDDNERKLVSEGKWEEVYQMRTEKMRASHGEDITARQKAVDERDGTIGTLRASLGTMKIEQALGTALNTSGARPVKSGMEDILSRTHMAFGVDDDGEITTKLRGPKGDLLTMGEYIDSLAKSASHLFETGGGGGATGGGGTTRRGHSGKIKVDRSDPTQMAKYHKEILEDKVEFLN